MESKQSIFDLPTDVRQLPGINDPMSRMQYEQHAPTRDVTGTNFPNGQIHHRFEVSGTKRWIPSKSYIRMRCQLGKTIAGGVVTKQLASYDDVAPNMGLCANLFQSGEFRIADKTVSRCSDYMAQIDALETRMDKSKGWLDSVGKVTNFWQADHKERAQEVSFDGRDLKSSTVGAEVVTSAAIIAASRAVGDDTVAWDRTGGAAEGLITFAAGTAAVAPATNFNCQVEFDVGDILVFGAGNLAQYNLKVVSVVDALNISVAGGAAIADIAATILTTNTFSIIKAGKENSRRVKDLELTWQPPMSIFKCDKALPAGRYELVLNPQTASSYKLRAIEALAAKISGTDYDFRIVDMYLYVATVESDRIDDLSYYINLDETRCQVDTGLGSNGSLGQKNFDVSPSTYALTCAFQDSSAGSDVLYSASKFKVQNDEELGLTRLFLTYGGQSKPSPDADIDFDSAGIDRTTQRYADSLLQSGQYFREGGSESLEEFHERGSYYHFAWPRDGRDRSTRAQVNAQLDTTGNARVLLFDHYKSVAHVTVKDGRVVDVSLMEA